MKCPYCGQEAVWCENKEIYGRNFGRSYMMYLCKPCDARVGCHQNSKRALGTMANKELREWRMKAHAVIDPLWRDGKLPRSEVYRRLSKVIGVEVHVGEADVEMCQKIIQVLPTIA
jgi:hypothetical protein